LVSGEPNTLYTPLSSVPGHCKDEEARTVSSVAPSLPVSSPLAANHCEVSGNGDSALKGPWSALNENYGMLS
jgi:hypothetical protein